jgi:dethiobiotin synthetase
VKRIIFITGTDTGVGKTVLTALLLSHLRSEGRNALAMKPFCSGSRSDARILQALERGVLTLDEINPFYFDKPLAPAASPKKVPLRVVLAKIRALSRRCDILLIEGAGGLLAPLGENYTARDLIAALHTEVIIVGSNQLGVINHVLLTVEALQTTENKQVAVVLMDAAKPDSSVSQNPEMLRKRLGKAVLLTVPFLGKRASLPSEAKKNAVFLKKTLATFS